MKRAAAFLLPFFLSCQQPPLNVSATKAMLLADGYDDIVFRMDRNSEPPRIDFVGDALSCHLRKFQSSDGYWQARLSAGVLPGIVRVKFSCRRQTLIRSIPLNPETTDAASDGTPDFLRLEDESDRQSFQGWMTYLAELLYFVAPSSRPSEIKDCSSLVRYAYREAMRDHNAAWIAEARLPILGASSSIKKYSFPHTLLGPKIFRTRPGLYSPPDLTNGSFAEFADAKTLQKCNTFFISRDVTRAQPGDILFYRRLTSKGLSYHSMIFIGASQVKPDSEIYVVYHTGPDGTSDGEIRRLTLTQLLHFPNPQWQPIAANELFLGVYRWNILKVIS